MSIEGLDTDSEVGQDTAERIVVGFDEIRREIKRRDLSFRRDRARIDEILYISSLASGIWARGFRFSLKTKGENTEIVISRRNSRREYMTADHFRRFWTHSA